VAEASGAADGAADGVALAGAGVVVGTAAVGAAAVGAAAVLGPGAAADCPPIAVLQAVAARTDSTASARAPARSSLITTRS
jgi:hypothetical protein